MKNRPFAKKSLGQNFLVDAGVTARIVAALELSPDDTVVEIGPGRGALTECLVASGANVIAIELDRELVPLLREKFSDRDNFSLTEADALEVDFETLTGPTPQSAKLVANLPYYISTAILQRLIEQRAAFSQMVLMFQKEVVDRITAQPGDSERGFLTVLVEAFLDSERLFDVPPRSFRPVPKVHSSVIRLTPRECRSPHVSKGGVAEAEFRKLVSAAFAQKRKTILNNLKHAYPNAAGTLSAAGIDPKRRAESLNLEEWLRLHENLHG